MNTRMHLYIHMNIILYMHSTQERNVRTYLLQYLYGVGEQVPLDAADQDIFPHHNAHDHQQRHPERAVLHQSSEQLRACVCIYGECTRVS
jgi:hypothetical protein